MYTSINRGNVRGIRFIGAFARMEGTVIVDLYGGGLIEFICHDKRLTQVYLLHPGYATAGECLRFVESILRPGQWRMIVAQMHKTRSQRNG